LISSFDSLWGTSRAICFARISHSMIGTPQKPAGIVDNSRLHSRSCECDALSSSVVKRCYRPILTLPLRLVRQQIQPTPPSWSLVLVAFDPVWLWIRKMLHFVSYLCPCLNVTLHTKEFKYYRQILNCRRIHSVPKHFKLWEKLILSFFLRSPRQCSETESTLTYTESEKLRALPNPWLWFFGSVEWKVGSWRNGFAIILSAKGWCKL